MTTYLDLAINFSQKYVSEVRRIDNSNISTKQKIQTDIQVNNHSSYFYNFKIEFSNRSCRINSGSEIYKCDHVFYEK